MTNSSAAVDWNGILKPSLRGVEPYDPGLGRDDLRLEYGLDHLDALNWNEDLFGPPPEVLAAAAESLATAWMYPDDTQTEFRAQVAAALDVSADSVVPAHGAQALIFAIAAAFLDAESSVVVPSSTYGLYSQASASAGATVITVPNRGLEIDLELTAATARGARARLIWLCDPNNPTGLGLDEGRWQRFLNQLPPGCAVVLDQAYVDFAPVDAAARIGDVRAGKPVILIRTFSKIFGMAGLRLGYAVAGEAACGALNAVQGPFSVNRVALAAGKAALGLPAFVAERRREVAAARTLLSDLLAAEGMEPVPSQANFVLVQVGGDDVEFADRLARRGIVVRPGSQFDLRGYVRVTVAPAATMHRAAAEMAAVRAELGAD